MLLMQRHKKNVECFLLGHTNVSWQTLGLFLNKILQSSTEGQHSDCAPDQQLRSCKRLNVLFWDSALQKDGHSPTLCKAFCCRVNLWSQGLTEKVATLTIEYMLDLADCYLWLLFDRLGVMGCINVKICKVTLIRHL